MGTLFTSVYDRFLGKVTDDMWTIAKDNSWTKKDVIDDLQNLLIGAIPGFEFPRKSLEYTIITSEESEDVDSSYFNSELTSEEINILAILMMESWLQRQITSIENIRMKYSGADFKMTSQANHLAKLLTLLTEVQRQSIHMQRLYKRRKTDENGNITSNWSVFSTTEQQNIKKDNDYVYLVAKKEK